MNFAGVGPAELLVILIIALLVFGPQRLPQVAKDLGKSIGKWRQALNEIQSVADVPMKELKEALDPASVEKKLQESVQQIVTPMQQDQEKADHEVTKQVQKPEGPEAKDECQTSSG